VEPFKISGIGEWPLVSTWISPPPLEINGPHCVKFLHQMGKLLLNLTPDEPPAMVKELPFFDDPIELDVLLAVALHLGVHDPIKYLLLHAFRTELCRIQVLNHI
jgi:hypothetical protein